MEENENKTPSVDGSKAPVDKIKKNQQSEKPKQKNELYFKLNPKRAAYWASEDERIVLSLAEAAERGAGRLYGTANSKLLLSFREVQKAIDFNLLEEVSKKEYETNKDSTVKVPRLDLSAVLEKRFSMDRKVVSILRLEGKDGEDKLIYYIKHQSDPNILTSMIKIEETNKHRANILRELDISLRKSEASGISALVNEGKGGDYTFDESKIAQNKEEQK